jgi:hypothetical protein
LLLNQVTALSIRSDQNILPAVIKKHFNLSGKSFYTAYNKLA